MRSEVYAEESITSIDFFKTIISRMMNAFALHKIILDDEGKPCDYEFMDVNPSFEILTGLKKSDVLGKKVSEIIPNIKEDEVDWIDIYGNVAIKGESISFDSYSKFLGKWYIINAYSPKNGYFITVFSDISQMKMNELALHKKNEELFDTHEKLQHITYHDYLTGLPNRVSLYNNTKMKLEDFPSSSMALFYIETDNFKFINGTLGHPFGEKLIIEISNRLSSLFYNDHKIYRLDGAEFILFIYSFIREDELKECAERIIQCFKTPFNLEGSKLHTTVNIGIALYPEHGNSVEELLKNADIAMNNAKDYGKNKFVFYNQAMHKAVTEKLVMEKHLHTALENQEFEIYYQPQLDLSTKEVCGFEALLRWHNPELGFVSPLVFIEVAEDTHLIIPIGKWVLRNACYFIKKLQNKGHTDFTVAVNVSVIQLIQDDFVDTVLTLLDLIDLEPKYLELEITESILVESFDVIFKKLECLRERGIKIALDDFGKGYSSLSDLHNLPIDILKIDKIFIDSILDQDACNCITDMIIILGRKMGMTVLAEGVETEEQMNYLIENQCHRMQGYLFSKPVPEKEILDRFIKNTESNTYIYGFEWKDEYSINIGSIDAQHKKLFEIGNKLSELVFSKESFHNGKELLSILQELKKYTEHHFKYEENLMKMHGYVHFETHKNEHKTFFEKVHKAHNELNNYMEKDYFVYLIDMVSVWIINHILKEDMKFKDFLSSK